METENEVLKRPANCINNVELICNFVINGPQHLLALNHVK